MFSLRIGRSDRPDRTNVKRPKIPLIQSCSRMRGEGGGERGRLDGFGHPKERGKITLEKLCIMHRFSTGKR